MTECSKCGTNFGNLDVKCRQCGELRAEVEVPSPEPASAFDHDHFAATLTALREVPRKAGAQWFWVSLAAYVLAVGWGNWWALIFLIPVLLFHEMGHYVAMRAFGQADARIFFLPFFGAVTTSRTRNEQAWQRAIVLLAGPVPGILLGAGLMLGGDFARAWGLGLLLINGLNLLPFAFLDGGRLITTLFSTRSGRFEAVVSIVPGVAAAIYAITQQDLWIGMMGYVSVVSGFKQMTLATKAAKLEGSLPSRLEDCSEDQLQSLHVAATQSSGVSSTPRPAIVAGTMRELHWRNRVQRPKAWEQAALLGVYVAALVLAALPLLE